MVGSKNPKSGWWNDKFEAAMERKTVVWKDVVEVSEVDVKAICVEIYKENKMDKICQNKKDTNEQFGRKTSQNACRIC